MLWTCPKCGKKLRISNEQLISNDGVIVCPQCLLQERQPIDRPVDMSRYYHSERYHVATDYTKAAYWWKEAANN